LVSTSLETVPDREGYSCVANLKRRDYRDTCLGMITIVQQNRRRSAKK